MLGSIFIMLSFKSEFKIDLENIYVSFFSYYVITK